MLLLCRYTLPKSCQRPHSLNTRLRVSINLVYNYQTNHFRVHRGFPYNTFPLHYMPVYMSRPASYRLLKRTLQHSRRHLLFLQEISQSAVLFLLKSCPHRLTLTIIQASLFRHKTSHFSFHRPINLIGL